MGIPGKDLPNEPFLNFDKVAHLIVFCIFNLLLINGFRKQYTIQLFAIKPYLFTTIIAIAYGGITEFLQGIIFVDRYADIFDFIANAIGSLFGLLAFHVIKKTHHN